MYLAIDQEAVIRSAFEMPALPQSTVRLGCIVAKEDTELSEIVQVIEFDPALTLKLLRVANSVYSSSSRQIGTVKDAVIRLGAGAIMGLAVGSCIHPTVAREVPGYHLSGIDFWNHSLAAAMATESLRSYARQRVSPLAFTAALLHDIGKVVLGNFLQPEFLELLNSASRIGKKAVFRAEVEILSMHHGEVGGVVAQHWGLPDTVVKGISFHHNPESSDDPIAYVTHFANYVAHEVVPLASATGTDATLNDPNDIVEDMDRIGLLPEQLPKIFQIVRERLSAVAADYK